MDLRPEKQLAVAAAIRLVPQYAELLEELRKEGHIGFQPEILQMQSRIGSYVLNYDNELKIGCSLFLALMGEDGFKSFCKELNSSSAYEQHAYINEMLATHGAEFDDFLSQISFPSCPEEWESARRELDALPEEDRQAAIKAGTFFWSFYFGFFFNTISLMMHGAKLTALVPAALEGDQEAFFKAVQIDRMLLLHHPYFRERKAIAQNSGDTAFLSKLAYREAASPLKGKIRYPSLYILFSVLDSFMWLDQMTHAEILDICDQAGLDRYQNRIEDVNYVTKRLGDYRKWQSSSLMSMQSKKT